MEPKILTRLTREEIVPSEAYAFLASAEVGAISVFLGTTRRWTGQSETTTLFYEAYESMAESELQRLAMDIAGAFGLHAIIIIHRLGEVPLGEASVLFGVSASHRKEAFAAVEEGMRRLKADIPIWKQDEDAQGSRQWK